jgi:hypothetical protein
MLQMGQTTAALAKWRKKARRSIDEASNLCFRMLTQFVRMINGNCKVRNIPTLAVECRMIHLSAEVEACTAGRDCGMADCLGLCDYVDDICQGCGRDFSLYAEEEKIEAAPEGGGAALQEKTS